MKTLKPLTPDAAFKKGADYGVELIVLYGSLAALSIYEVNKQWGKNLKEENRKVAL